MKILFLDQSGRLGGAELCLTDIAVFYKLTCLVGLFADGDFKDLLEKKQVPTQLLTKQSIQVRKSSGVLQGIVGSLSLLPLLVKTAQLAQHYDLVYANTQKALIVGAINSFIARRPLVYHLHDILSAQHFSVINLRVAITLANQFSSVVIANSQASKSAFIAAGGNADLVTVIHNGFDLRDYQVSTEEIDRYRQSLALQGKFVVGHFSRLSPWKGQHILIEALKDCPDNVVAILVGDALFGEQDYADQLHRQVKNLGLEDRVKFLGFRSDIPQLMAACDLIAHTSTAPEPFGRVIVEGMLCGVPVVAAAAGGAAEIIESSKTGWLSPPGDVQALVTTIRCCHDDPATARVIAQAGYKNARERFSLETTLAQIDQVLHNSVYRQQQPQ